MRKLLVFQVLILFICVAVYTQALSMQKTEKSHESIIKLDDQSPGLNSESTQEDNNPIVFITKSGRKYHSDNCSSLARSKIKIKLSDAKSRGYTPCSRCNPPR